MYIEEIAIEGFKSYAQRTVVRDFDSKFNAITGLNGSGKSNILDSICFVLGITNLQHVRASNLQELIYKQGQAGVTRATVSIVFNNHDKAGSPVGYEDHDRITVTRQIVIGGRNKYLINGHVKQPSAVQTLFHSVQLNVNNPHFLIMQGRITKVLNMKPPEILSMLEVAAGTRMYENKKESALKTLEKKQTKVEEINKVLTEEILPRLEGLRRERAQYQAWLQGNSDIDRLSRFCVAYEYFLAEKAKNSAVEVVEKIRESIAELARVEEECHEAIVTKKGLIKEMLLEKDRQMGDAMKEVQERADKIAKELVKVTSVWNNKSETLEAEKKALEQLVKKLADMRKGSEERAAQMQSADDELAAVQSEADTKAKALADAEEEYAAVQAGKTGHPGEDKTMAQKLSELKAAAVEAATGGKQAALRVTHLRKEVAEKGRLVAGKRKAASGLEQRLAGMAEEVARCEAGLQRLGHDEQHYSGLEKSKAEKEAAVGELRQRVEGASRELGVGFSYSDPERGFDRRKVKGVLARLFRMRDASMATALEVSFWDDEAWWGGGMVGWWDGGVVGWWGGGMAGWRDGGMAGWRVGWRDGGWDGGMAGGMAGWRVGWRDGGWDGGMVGWRAGEAQGLGWLRPPWLFCMCDTSMCTALGVVAGGRLHNVVVDSEQTGKQLLSHGRLQRRVTLIPLNKIDSRCISQAKLNRAIQLVGKENVWTAISAVDFDPELQPAMAFAFGNTFICRDSATAKKVAFHPDVMTPCVTLDGDSYNPGGLLTGGSRRGGGVLLSRLHAVKEDEEQLAALEAQLQQVLAEDTLAGPRLWCAPLSFLVALQQKRQQYIPAAPDSRIALQALLFICPLVCLPVLLTARQLSALQQQRQQYVELTQQLQLKAHQLSLAQEQMKQSEHHQLAEELAALEAELAECEATSAEAAGKEKGLLDEAAALEREMEQQGRERGQRLKALEAKAKAAKQQAAAASKALKAKQNEREQLAIAVEASRGEEAAAQEQISAAEVEVGRLQHEVDEAARKVADVKEELDAVQGDVERRQNELRACDERMAGVEREVGEMEERKMNAGMEKRKLEHQVKTREAEQQRGVKDVERMERQHAWIATERALFGRAGTDYDFNSRDPVAARQLLAEKQSQQSSVEKRINKKVIAMFDKTEQEYKDLTAKKDIVLRDKAKIEEAIEQLDEKKKQQLKVTWEKVTKDFGSIFSTLLPGTTAKLDPPEGQDFLAGLEVKVAFGGVWKHSLSELSGGQRSLLALSLILALLLFKPAPLYILDEVDAALDLNHTQNIGHMIKQHFPHSQFIVVSLKEGMFNNANVIFRTKFIDGVSTVTRTVPSLPSSAAGLSRAAPGAANGGRSRGAAASVATGKSAAGSMRSRQEDAENIEPSEVL
ncbi:unnamed protein product [Closterium sp. Naga37s-1]|nr:unnamed protein product [Closterium sp. Naga37s-1]